MTRRWGVFAVGLLLVAGCGRATPRTATEQALTYLRTGAYDKAIAACDEALQLNPQDAEAYLYRGRAYQFRDNPGDRDRAIAEFSQAIRIAPKDPEAYYSRSIAYRDQGQAEKSAEDEKQYRQLDSRIEQYYSQLPDTTPAIATDSQAQANEPSDDTSDDVKADDGKSAKGSIDSDLDEYRRLQRRFGGASAHESTEPNEADIQIRPRYRPSATDADDEEQAAPERPLPKSKPRATARPADRGNSQGSPLSRYRPSDAYRAGSAPPVTAGGGFGAARDPWLGDQAGVQTSPWAPRTSAGPNATAQPQFQSPWQPRVPFPQRSPRPTGFVDDPAPYSPYTALPLPYNNPSTVQLPGAYHSDYDP